MATTLRSVLGNELWLDGGAMFGNCPRSLWQRWCEPDAAGRIRLASRALLLQSATRCVLFETGVGAFFEPTLAERYGVVGRDHRLVHELASCGVTPDDVDAVVLSHLHFDHAGGLLCAYDASASLKLAFPRARFVVGAAAWARARAPHVRDARSFIPGLTELLAASGRLELVPDGVVAAPHPAPLRSAFLDECCGPLVSFFVTHGHTPGQLHALLAIGSERVCFLGDLVPGQAWLRPSLSMGYDRAPELLVDEKRALLDELVEQRALAFFTHDPDVAAVRLTKTSGGYEVVEACRELRL